MVFGNVPKLHGLIAILAGVIAVPTGCSGGDFSGCKVSRTCPPPGGSSGEGGDGDTGGTDRGGTSSGTGGTRGGTAGTDEGGNGGTPDPDDTERPTIVSFSPDDGDVDVERDVTATVTFSEALDAESVSETSVVLTGPDGDVAGTASVDGDVVTFVAEKPLYLLGDYTLTLGETIADLAGNTLGDEASVGFRVRDGRWSEPTYPFGETVPRVATRFGRNHSGDVVLGMEVWPSQSNLYAGTYNALENQWTSASELPSVPGAFFSTFPLALDPSRRALATWGSNIGSYGSARMDDEERWTDAGPLGGYTDVAVTTTGLATAVRRGSGEIVTNTLDLANGIPEPETSFSYAGTVFGPWPVASLERMAILATRSTAGLEELTIAWKAGTSWASPEVLASSPDIGRFSYDSDELGNILVVWREVDEMRARIYHRATEQWTREMLVASTTTDALAADVDLTSGNAIVTFHTPAPELGAWVAVYHSGVGWLEDSLVRLDGEWYGGAIGVSVDRSGNAVATWMSDFRVRRYIPGMGWRFGLPFNEASVNQYYMWAAGARDGSVLVASNSMAGDENRVPWVTRFE